MIGLFLGACNNSVNSSESDTVVVDTCVEMTDEQRLVERSKKDIHLFGVETKCDPERIIIDLSKAGVFKVDKISRVSEEVIMRHNVDGDIQADTIRYEKERVRSAIVEFAGVKFGLNVNYDKGYFRFNFITSIPIDQSYTPLKNTIAKYYGNPEDVADEYSCSWHTFSDEGPWIRIRPLHSDDGGTVMMWQRF